MNLEGHLNEEEILITDSKTFFQSTKMTLKAWVKQSSDDTEYIGNLLYFFEIFFKM